MRRDNLDVDERDVGDWPADWGTAATRTEAAARGAVIVAAVRCRRVCVVVYVVGVLRDHLRVRSVCAVHRVRASGHRFAIVDGACVECPDFG
jgi:hypothetical protein